MADFVTCENPPCDQVGPFRYCPVKGCGWMDEPSDVEVVCVAIEKAVEERRSDTEFMGRLRRSIERHGVLLDRLAATEGQEGGSSE